ncbi:MAG: hypothetical protein LKE48_02755 [Solobacterium sp.]|jgi:hypothetical protein|nr:hypothetical protein [Solobacterium sp.]
MPSETIQQLCETVEKLIGCIRKQDDIIQQAQIPIMAKEEAARIADEAERVFNSSMNG